MTYDIAILGLGAMGSAALATLASRGKRVVGLEQFPLGHDRGSSHGQSRIIRTAYYEDPCYVPLCKRSFELWRALERDSGQSLLIPSPCLSVGMPDGEMIQGVLASAREHQLNVTSLSRKQIHERYPAFRIPDGMMGVVENDAGILKVERCVQAHLDQAIARGATIHSETPVLNWSTNEKGVLLETTHGRIEAEHLIITAGAWSTGFLPHLKVMRQTMHWFGSRVNIPIFLLDLPHGAFYGLPAIDGQGIKVAQHYGAPELDRPDQIDWSIHDSDLRQVFDFLKEYLPEISTCLKSQVCMYTLSPDRHFVIDRHPMLPNVTIATGFSGHGFKFAPVVGEILTDLATLGKTSWKIEPFSATRSTIIPA